MTRSVTGYILSEAQNYNNFRAGQTHKTFVPYKKVSLVHVL